MTSWRREIFPITNFTTFLSEAKVEFDGLTCVSGCSENVKYEDFDFLKTLGLGAFGSIFFAKMKETKNYYTIKVLRKKVIVKNRQNTHVINEKRILQALNFPFTIYLIYAFFDNSYIYFVLPFLKCGELFSHLKLLGRFSEDLSRFYSAQILLGLEYLHFCDVIFRDVKPENILIDDKGFLKITNFEFSKIVRDRTYTLCGTPEYLAPEIILNKAYGKAIDWWSFGVLLFEIVAGYPPFHASDPLKIYEKVIAGNYKFPLYFSYDLKNLIRNLLQNDMSRRYGSLKNGIDDIKNHRWYRHISWLALLNYKVEPEYIPEFDEFDFTKHYGEFKERNLHFSRMDDYAEEFVEF